MTDSSPSNPLPDTSGAGAPHEGGPVLHAGAALADASIAMIMVHGRGAGPADILGLSTLFENPAVACLAPGASGNTWYPNSFLSPRERNQPGISSGLGVIGALVEGVEAAGVPRERQVLLGFSQGACLASEFAYRNPGRFGGVVLYSGGLIGPLGSEWETDGKMEDTPVFLGCSDVDAHIPVERVHETAEVFQAMGAAVTPRIYPGMGHLVNEDEIHFTRGLLKHLTSE